MTEERKFEIGYLFAKNLILARGSWRMAIKDKKLELSYEKFLNDYYSPMGPISKQELKEFSELLNADCTEEAIKFSSSEYVSNKTRESEKENFTQLIKEFFP